MGLKLDRRVGQAVILPADVPSEDIVVRVAEITEDRNGRPQVRLEFFSHPDQAIYRTELWKRIEQNEAASGSPRRG